MNFLTRDQAEKIAEVTSSIFQQGATWVLREHELSTGQVRLTRGLSHSGAKRRLKQWRREKVEELLRADGKAKAYAIRKFHKNPSWNGEGVWHWASTSWYTNKEDAERELAKKSAKHVDIDFDIFELETSELPGHFAVA